MRPAGKQRKEISMSRYTIYANRVPGREWHPVPPCQTDALCTSRASSFSFMFGPQDILCINCPSILNSFVLHLELHHISACRIIAREKRGRSNRPRIKDVEFMRRCADCTAATVINSKKKEEKKKKNNINIDHFTIVAFPGIVPLPKLF